MEQHPCCSSRVLSFERLPLRLKELLFFQHQSMRIAEVHSPTYWCHPHISTRQRFGTGQQSSEPPRNRRRARGRAEEQGRFRSGGKVGRNPRGSCAGTRGWHSGTNPQAGCAQPGSRSATRTLRAGHSRARLLLLLPTSPEPPGPLQPVPVPHPPVPAGRARPRARARSSPR